MADSDTPNPWDVRTIAKFVSAIAALIVAIGVIGSFASTRVTAQVKNEIAADFTTKKEMSEHIAAVKDKFSQVDKNTKAVEDLTEITKATQITQLTYQISDIKGFIAAMEENRQNWKSYESGVYREKKDLLEELIKQRDRLRGL